jgi:hypothetical protein
MGTQTPRFWSSPAQGTPKRQNRFLFEATIADEDVTFFCKTAGRPGYTVTEAEHRFLNHKFYYPGIVEWETLDVALVDPVEPSMTEIFWVALGNMGWVRPSEVQISATDVSGVVSKKRASSPLAGMSNIRISTLDGEGVVTEQWSLKNAWIQAVKFNDFDYSGDDLMDTTLTIRFDWAEFIKGAGGDSVRLRHE